jgi:hypothetical protein
VAKAQNNGDSSSDRLAEATRALYSGEPEQFLVRRGELADAARAAGDAEAGRQIAALRKPTLAAAIVNHAIYAYPDAVGRLMDLGARLRAAQEAFDAAALRDLTGERRMLVDNLTRRALATTAGKGRRITPSLRDEITATIDAAVAEPEVAARLGRLTKAEHWSGFGFDIGAAPNLTLVQGGKSGAAEPAAEAPKKQSGKKPTPAELRRIRAEIDRATVAYDQIDADYGGLQDFERACIEAVRQAEADLEAAQQRLAEEKAELQDIRAQLREKRKYHREARLALDRAMRKAPPVEPD